MPRTSLKQDLLYSLGATQTVCEISRNEATARFAMAAWNGVAGVDVLRCETELLEKRPSKSRPEMGSTRSQMTVFNQNDEPVLRFTALGLMRTRPV